MAVPIAGVLIAVLLFLWPRINLSWLTRFTPGRQITEFLFNHWAMDRLYDRLLVTPYKNIAVRNHQDIVDRFYDATADSVRSLHNLSTRSQTGQLRTYATVMVLGLILLGAIALGSRPVMTMIIVIAILFLGGLTAWLAEGWNENLPRWVSVISCLLAGVVLLPMALVTTEQEVLLNGVPSTWLSVVNYPWIPRFGIGFVFALDGLSLLMVALTLFLGFVAVLSSWDEIKFRGGFFQFNLMWTLAGVVGVFVSLDLFLLLFLLGSHVNPHVSAHRHLGTREQGLCFHEVFSVHADQWSVNAGSDSGTGLRQ